MKKWVSTRVLNFIALVLAGSIGSLLAILVPGSGPESAVAAEPISTAVALDDEVDADEDVVAAEPDAEPEDGSADSLPSEHVWREVARPTPDHEATAGVQPLATPVSGTPDNPFANTCDGRAIGFLTATGDRPRMEFRDVPEGAILECRSGRSAAVGKMPFVPCDGGDGRKGVHQPALTAEGRHRTEVRYRLGTSTGPTMQTSYYVHRSLDRAPCCQASLTDAAWFTAARLSIKPAAAFDATTRLDNPVITIAAQTRSGAVSESVLSLRRTFRLSDDRRLLLIRRTMASRRTLEKTRATSCVGLSIAVPKMGIRRIDVPSCPDYNESPYRGPGARSGPKCPSIYCTVTSCRQTTPDCIQVTYTFNRGPGQQPWVKRVQPQCADERLLSLSTFQCNAYVLNRSGDAVCLVNQKERITSVATIDGTRAPLGLTLLGQQRDPVSGPDHYVFSGKTTRRAGITNLLYLPQ